MEQHVRKATLGNRPIRTLASRSTKCMKTSEETNCGAAAAAAIAAAAFFVSPTAEASAASSAMGSRMSERYLYIYEQSARRHESASPHLAEMLIGKPVI